VESQTHVVSAPHHCNTAPLHGTSWITAPQEEFPDLYPIYVAYTDRLANEETKGDTQYTQLSSGDFRRLSPTRQIAEFRTLGVDAHTDQEVLKLLLGPAPTDNADKYDLPTTTVTELPLLDILHHERYLGRHIRNAAKRRGDAIRQASLLTRSLGHPSNHTESFQSIIATVQQLTKALDEDRRLHLLLTNRRKALLKHLRHQPPVILTISTSTLADLTHSNYYDPLLDEVDRLQPAGGDSIASDPLPSPSPQDLGDTPSHNWSPRRTRHQRAQAKPSQPTATPMEITLEHAKDLSRSAPPQAVPHRLPDPGPFSLTGGYKTTRAATIAQQLVVTYLNVGTYSSIN
jgi:hypothetical protein